MSVWIGEMAAPFCLFLASYFLFLISYFLFPCSTLVMVWDDVVTQTVGGNNPAPVQRCRHNWSSGGEVAEHK